MDMLLGFGLGILVATLSYLAGRFGVREKTRQDAPGSMIPGPSKAEVDALAAKVRALSLEWEDTNDRLLRKVRSLRAASRAVNGGDEPAEPEPEPQPASQRQSRAAILAEYRRKNAARQ